MNNKGSLTRLLSDLIELDKERAYMQGARLEQLNSQADMIELEVREYVKDVHCMSINDGIEDTLNDLAYCLTLGGYNNHTSAMIRRLEYIFEGVAEDDCPL